MIIKVPGKFWERGLYSAFSIPNLGIASLLFFSLCFPQVSFFGRCMWLKLGLVRGGRENNLDSGEQGGGVDYGEGVSHQCLEMF